jgi:di/tricarboxylate transporter
MFFTIGFIVATIGAGATPASALLAPPAMAVAGRAGVPPLLMAIMTGNGALAGTLSPFAPTGIVAHGVMARIGLGGVEWQTFAYNALAHTIVGFGGFLVLGGWKLFARGHRQELEGTNLPAKAGSHTAEEPETGPLQSRHWLTTAAIVILIVTVAGLGLNVGMMAVILATALVLLRTVDEGKAIQRMPWGVILMVTGVTVLVTMMQETQGLALITTGIANVSTPETIEPVVAFGTGLVSVYSSTSGVVLPAFLPMVPELAERLGGINPLDIAWSMNVSASLVDLSSLSTVGALYIAGAAPGSDVRKLFNGLLVWGLSMAVVGAGLCWLLFG